MKKRILILLVVSFLAVSAIWAESNNSAKSYFSVGLTLSKSDFVYHKDSQLHDIIPYDPNKTDGIAMGAEARLKLSFFRFDVNGEFSVLSPKALYFNGVADLGAELDIKNVVGVGLGIGPNMMFIFNSDGSTPLYWGSDDEDPRPASIFYAWVHSYFNYRVTLDAIVGPVMRVGLAYTFPTKFNLELFKLAELNPFKKGNIDSGKLAVCIQMRVF